MQQELALQILKSGRNAFLTGSPGAGKTYVLNKYIKWLRDNGIKAAITASTGIAATHLSGQTIHSWSGIGIKTYLNEWDIDALSQNQTLVKRLNSIDVLIIDEISMISADFFDSLNTLLKHLRQNSKAFGGVQLVVSGDFFQLPPVSTNLNFAFQSNAWQEAEFKILYLSSQYRQKDKLQEILESIRNNSITEQEKELILKRLNIKPKDTNIIKLETHNKNVDEFNEQKLLELKAKKVYEYPAELKGNKAKAENILRNILAPEILKLKEGARVIFVKNDPYGEYVNGSLGQVVGFSDGYPVVQLDNGGTVKATPVNWEMVNEDGKTLATVTQVPLKLAWAITIHKSQGMSLDAAKINLEQSFVEGQGYVALSRLKSLDGLYLEGINEMAFKVNSLVSEFDRQLKIESKKVEYVYTNFSLEKRRAMQSEFLSKAGVKTEEKEDTYTKTKLVVIELAEKRAEFSINDIAEARNLKKQTIIRHIEELINRGEKLPLHKLEELKNVNLKEIHGAFLKDGAEKLSPVFNRLGGKYDYDILSIARALFMQEKLL